MDQAQIARELARGNGFHTRMVRPYTWSQFLASGHDVSASTQMDTAEPPLHSLLLAPLFKLLESQWEYKGQQNIFILDRVVACLSVVFLLASMLVIWLTVRKLFDKRIAGWVLVALLFCQPLWDAARSGLPLMTVLFFFSLAFYLFVIGLEKTNDGESCANIALGIGVLGAAMVMTHWMAVWLVLGLVACVALYLRPHVKTPLLAALPLLLAILAWSIHNYSVCGDYMGASKATLLSMLSVSGDTSLLRNFGAASAPLAVNGMLHKIAFNFSSQISNIFGHLGAIVPAALFFISLLHPYKRVETAAFRWALLLVWFCAMLGMTLVGLPERETDDRQLHLLFVPFMAAYGFAFIAVQWARLGVSGMGWLAHNGAAAAVTIISALPMLTTLPQEIELGLYYKNVLTHWPPYKPEGIAKLREFTEPGEVLFTDAPWATAWYADRHSVWLPQEREQFAQMKLIMELHGEIIAGLVMSPLSTKVNGSVGSFFDGDYKDWATESLRGVVLALGVDLSMQNDQLYKETLPLAGRMVNGRIVAEMVFLTDRRRW